MTDPAIVQAPFGPEVDGRRLLGEAVGFGRALRAARPRDRPRRGRRLRPGADARRHRRPRAGPRRRRGDLRPAPGRPGRLRRGLRPLVAPPALALPGDFEPPPMRRARTPPPTEDGRGPAPQPPRPATSAIDDGSPTSAACRSRPTSDDEDDEAPIEGVVDLARRLQPGRGPAPPRVRPDDAGRAARGGAPRRPARPAARAATDPPLRAPFARPAARAAGDVPAQPRDRRPAR